MGFFQRREEARANREQMRFAKERFEKHLKEGKSAEEAGDAALADAQEKFGAIDITKWMAILQLIMQLIELFKKPVAVILLSLALTGVAQAGPLRVCAGGACRVAGAAKRVVGIERRQERRADRGEDGRWRLRWWLND